MPATSGKQYRYMQMRAHSNMDSATGPSKKVAEEFIHKTKPALRSKWASKKRKKKD